MTDQYYVYVLRSQKSGYRYIGQTNDLQKRLTEHNAGLTAATRNQKPYSLEYSEVYKTRKEAMQRERFLKSGQGREWLNQNVK
ncbi:MAG: GIY-YIG nuclease family protein [Candidatus Kerfeldbacteria bacterium]|nr:GIY-YIG nuclease family protein [Candidatus Kerfeldbacteria bacterium]